MKKTIELLLALGIVTLQQQAFPQIYLAKDAHKKISEASVIAYKKGLELPVYIKIEQGKEIDIADCEAWIKKADMLPGETGFTLLNKQTDMNGDEHYRYIQTYGNIPVFGTTYIVHSKNKKIYSINGEIVSLPETATIAGIDEKTALSFALAEVDAGIYKWQIQADEAMLKKISDNPDATYYPKGELYFVPENGDIKTGKFRLAYRFDVYAAKPLKREYVFVDANSGEIIFTLNRIHIIDSPGTAHTKYSGTQTITSDSYAGSFRLRETGRGNGIETYNMQTGINTSNAVDFTDADNDWNNINAEQDEVATDAHWGAEKTYDYYKNVFNRNSIDDNGFKLVSFVHYNDNYVNAYWDGASMTYGDGNNTYSPLTAIDICAHEITHGLDEHTANLIYQDESGALNEGYSDIFGTCIERYARPSGWDWLMAADIGEPFRSMSNPNAYGQPDTYHGINWDPNQEVHQNAGVLAYWFYLTSQGGSGTNDNGDTYNITGIGMDSAADVAYRTLTVYLPMSADYADARFYSVLSATDIFGACTPGVEAVTNAWYAAGVGLPYNPAVTSDFTADYFSFCITPAIVQFTNFSANANQFLWDFGDGTTSTDINPLHTYTTYGNFTVTLKSYGGACGMDSVAKTSFISVDTNNACMVYLPVTGTAQTQTSCAGSLFDSGGTGDYQDNTNSAVTIAPVAASYVILNFNSFNFENNYDYLYIYDGASTASPLIGKYSGSSLPNGGIITSTWGAVTIVQTSDEYTTRSGFDLTWQCVYPVTPPSSNFKANDTVSCSGTIMFTDLTTNGPLSWFWDFGDGSFSDVQNPVHTYSANGGYDVKLKTTNNIGVDSAVKSSYISVNIPSVPTVVSASRCDSGPVTLFASGSDTIHWYDAPTGGNMIFTGNTFITPVLGATTTFYAGNDVIPPPQYFGEFDNSIGTGSYFTSYTYHYLEFDCYSPLILKSVKVFSNQAKVRTIELRDYSDNVIQSASVNIPDGVSRVTLNFNIPAGTGLQLGTNGFNNLYRNKTGASYPYTLPGHIAITGNSANDDNYYYYFYDWEVQHEACFSDRVPVTAGILLPSVQITPAGNINVCAGDSVTLTSQTAGSYLWSPGGENTQSIIVNTAGSYSVYITDSACSATSDTVVVSLTSNFPVADFGYTNNDPVISFIDSSLYGDTYLWNFGDGNTSVLQNPAHTYSANGLYVVTLTVTNICGTNSVSYNVVITMAGVNEYPGNCVVSVYPNPAKDIFTLEIQSVLKQEINYTISDVIGNRIMTGILKPVSGNAKLTVDMKNHAKGIYFLELRNDAIHTTRKITVE